jgi:hypothetical protein
VSDETRICKKCGRIDNVREQLPVLDRVWKVEIYGLDIMLICGLCLTENFLEGWLKGLRDKNA